MMLKGIQNKLGQSVLLHLTFWLIYLLAWSARDLVYHKVYIENFRTNAFMAMPYAALIYLNYFVLVPKLLLKKKYLSYYLILIVGLTLTSYFAIVFIHWVFYNVYESSNGGDWFLSIEGYFVALSEVLMLLGFSLAFFFLEKWYQKERYARELEKRNLESELAMLKNQINPHFVFNTLNTAYMLMENKVEKAKEVLMQFSETLSHQLYDTSKDRIALSKEIDYLKNYIELEKLRHDDLLHLDFQCPKHLNGYKIAPMLLLPFVENAFKHGKSSNGYWIKLTLEIENSTLHFFTENSVNNQSNSTSAKSGGIGLANVKRRLNLIYPGAYDLNINSENGVFQSDLKIKLTK